MMCDMTFPTKDFHVVSLENCTAFMQWFLVMQFETTCLCTSLAAPPSGVEYLTTEGPPLTAIDGPSDTP